MNESRDSARADTCIARAGCRDQSAHAAHTEPRPGKAQDQPESDSRDVCPLGKVAAVMKQVTPVSNGLLARSHALHLAGALLMRTEAVEPLEGRER